MESKKLLHVVISSDSLSYPRPWKLKAPLERPDLFFAFEVTYPFLLETWLQEIFPGRRVKVTNLGRRGATIRTLTAVAPDILRGMSPDVAVLHHGIVDCWIRDGEARELRTTEDEFEAALAAFFDMRSEVAPHLPVLMLKVLHTNEEMLSRYPQQNELIDRYNAILERKAEQHAGVHALALHAQGEPLLHLDGSHLSRYGHKAAATLLTGMIAALEQGQGRRSALAWERPQTSGPWSALRRRWQLWKRVRAQSSRS